MPVLLGTSRGGARERCCILRNIDFFKKEMRGACKRVRQGPNEWLDGILGFSNGEPAMTLG